MLLFLVQGVSAQSTSAKKAFEQGIAAYNKNKYVEAFPYLEQAALGGVLEAYKLLIKLYADGEYDGSGIGNYKKALAWTVLAIDKYIDTGTNNRDLAVTCMMYYDPLCFLAGDYQETIDHATYGFKRGTPAHSYLMNQIAASYIMLDNIGEATEWLSKALDSAVEKNDNLSIHTAKALLSKIHLDKKEYTKALELSKDAATNGKIPLAAFVYGVSLIKTNNHPDIGKRWVKLAAEYDYNGIFEINCFEEEIGEYWRSIINTSF